MTNTKAHKRPSIYMIDSEADVLADLALGIEKRSPQVSALLLDEISRAKITTREKIPADVVTMNRLVEFTDEADGEVHAMKLVYPSDADIEAGRISILSLVGAGLIGMREGQSISWPDRSGHQRRLSITRVTGAPEAAAAEA